MILKGTDLLLVALCCPLLVSSYKYLMFTPGTYRKVGSQSHLHIASKIAQVLTSASHEVTIVLQGDELDLPGVKIMQSSSAFPDETFEQLREIVKIYTANQIEGIEAPRDQNLFIEVMTGQCIAMLTNTEMLESLRAEMFDFAIVDHFHGCGYLMARLLNLKFAVLECSSSISMLADSITAHPLSYVPVFSTRHTDQMSFLERVKNTLIWAILPSALMSFVDSPTTAAQAQSGVLPGTDLSRLRQEAEMWFVNNDWSLEFPRPTHPSTVFIGGILAEKQAKPISKELQDWIYNNTSKGLVVASFGSTLNIADMPKIQKLLLTAFGQLPYKVIIGSKVVLSEVPHNVKVMSWIPQADLLALSNDTKLLITHGGINSIYEAIYWGVPVLVFPVTMDGPDNAARVEAKGFGLQADLKSISPQDLVNKITTIIDNKSFQENAKKVSKVMQDTPQTAAERVLFWMEHLTRHGDGSHLRSKVFRLQWYEYLMLDVVLFFVAIFITVLMLIYSIIKCTCKRICSCLKRNKQKND